MVQNPRQHKPSAWKESVVQNPRQRKSSAWKESVVQNPRQHKSSAWKESVVQNPRQHKFSARKESVVQNPNQHKFSAWKESVVQNPRQHKSSKWKESVVQNPRQHNCAVLVWREKWRKHTFPHTHHSSDSPASITATGKVDNFLFFVYHRLPVSPLLGGKKRAVAVSKKLHMFCVVVLKSRAQLVRDHTEQVKAGNAVFSG